MVDPRDDADIELREGLETGTNRANWREVGNNHSRHLDEQERHKTPGAFGMSKRAAQNVHDGRLPDFAKNDGNPESVEKPVRWEEIDKKHNEEKKS